MPDHGAEGSVPVPASSGASRRRAAAVAGYTGDLTGARSALCDGFAEVRASGLSALAHLGALSVDDVRAALADPAAPVRRRACDLCGRMQAVVLATELVALLSDVVPDVVEAACYALGELGTSAGTEDAGWAATVVTALESTAVSHREPLCREAAVAALGALGFPEGLPAVLAAMADKPAVRRRAAVALAAFDGDEVGAALARAAQDPDWQVRQAAEDLLGRRPPG